LRAEFLLPSGIAVRKSDGALFISDEAAQRIRELTPTGEVHTIAGSGKLLPTGLAVQGDYRDGPARIAKFNRPAGLAIARDGSLYIADSLNGCIRRLSKNVVTTVAGKCSGTKAPSLPRAVDGMAQAARFIDPRGLAFDSTGNLYITDVGGGLRRLSRSGIVTTIPLKNSSDRELLGIAYADGSNPVVVATSPTTVAPYHPSTGTDDLVHYLTEGLRPFGEPNAIAAIDTRQFLFTDLRAQGIRYLRLPSPPFTLVPYTRLIAGSVDAATGLAGHRDGSLRQSKFNSPMGIAIRGNDAYVADAGNRRIRRITLPHFRVSELGLDEAYPVDKNHYEIALIGPSETFYDSLGDDSMCAQLEDVLNESHRLNRPVRCHSIRVDAASVPRLADYIENVFPTERMDAVIMYVVPWQPVVEPTSLRPNTSFWAVPVAEGTVAFRAQVENILKSLAPSRTSLSIVWSYLASDVSDTEGLVARERPSVLYPEPLTFMLPNETAHNIFAQYTAAFHGLPVRQYDLYEDVVKYEEGPDPIPIYESSDLHFNPRGHAFLARNIANGLLAEGFPAMPQ